MNGPQSQVGHGRRRVLRTGHVVSDLSTATTASSLQAGPSRLPDLSQLVDVEFSDLDQSSDDLESDDHATPRIKPISKLPAADSDLQTPAARLRALLNRVPNGSSSSTTPAASHPPPLFVSYESDSDADGTTHATATPSVAQTSLRSVFSHALRPPGDTPQKQRPRRNSLDISEVDTSPRTEKAKHAGKRKSLSDDEVENSYRTSSQTPSNTRARLQPSTLDVLRQRFMNNSKSQSGEGPSSSGKDYLSDDTADLLRELNSSRASPPAATSTPQHSLQMSTNSQFQLQSNLLDHDSEMQRVIGGADSYDDIAASGFAEPGDPSESRQEIVFPSSSEINTKRPTTPHSASSPPRTVNFPESSSTTRTPRRNISPSLRHSKETSPSIHKSPFGSPGQYIQERSTGSLSRAGSLPSLSTKPLAARSRFMSSPRGSDASSHSSSISRSEYKERVAELDQDQAHQRERDWNKPISNLSRPTSGLSSRSPDLSERQGTQSLNLNAATLRSQQISPSFPHTLRRHSLNFDRQDSPTSSAHGSQDEDPITAEVVHERERNWNSPRPVWYARTRADSISSTGSTSDADELDNPPSTTALPSSRPLSDIRNRLGRNRLHSTPEPSSPSLRNSPHVHNRLAAKALESISSPSRRQQSTSMSSSNSLSVSRESKSNPLITRTSLSSRTARLSLPSPSKSISMSSSTQVDKSTIHASRKSQIPVPSPKKSKGLQQRQPETETPHLPDAMSTSLNKERPNTGLQPPTMTKEGVSPQELTPTQKTIAPPLDDYPVLQPSSLQDDDVSDTEPPDGISESEANAPFNSTPFDSPNRELPSFTATPPRHGSSVTQSKINVQSPSQTFETPELPGPPSTDDSESEQTWKTPAPTRLFTTGSNTTTFKTPKPPGGWSDTPAPRRRNRAYSDSISMQRSPLEVPAADGPNWTAIQTPKPPGGWLATPAPARKVEYIDQSVETDTEPEPDINELSLSAAGEEVGHQPPAGLNTPASSLSRGKYHSTQTPAAPGAWVQTSAARKSVMKVRFDPDTSNDIAMGDDDTVPESTLSQPDQRVALHTPPASPDMAPISPSRRKSPHIRVLDAYGNVTHENGQLDLSSIKTPRRQPIRLVDALGNAIEDSNTEDAADKSEEVQPAPGNRGQILSRVRQGLDELVQEIHDLDRPGLLSKSELSRIRDLDSTSVASREKRRKLVEEMHSVNANLKSKVESLQSNGIQTSPPIPVQHTSSSKSRFVSFSFLVLVLLQVGLVVILYRLYATWTRDAFLTTYYDPYNPLIHLYTSKSKIFLTNLSKSTSWRSLFDLLRQRDFKTFGEKAMDNLSINLVQFQAFVWEKWGGDMTNQSTAWPPT